MPRLLCLGDSITDCGHLWEAPPLGNGYVNLLANKLNAHAGNWELTNAGADGFTIRRVLDILPRFEESRFDAVTLLAGINDVGVMMNTRSAPAQRSALMIEFFQNYRKVLERLCRLTGRILLMEPFVFPYPLEFVHWQPLVQEMSAGIAHLSREHGCVFIPLQESLDLLTNRQGIGAVTTDGIHLTALGHALLAEKLVAYLKEPRYNE